MAVRVTGSFIGLCACRKKRANSSRAIVAEMLEVDKPGFSPAPLTHWALQSGEFFRLACIRSAICNFAL